MCENSSGETVYRSRNEYAPINMHTHTFTLQTLCKYLKISSGEANQSEESGKRENNILCITCVCCEHVRCYVVTINSRKFVLLIACGGTISKNIFFPPGIERHVILSQASRQRPQRRFNLFSGIITSAHIHQHLNGLVALTEGIVNHSYAAFPGLATLTRTHSARMRLSAAAFGPPSFCERLVVFDGASRKHKFSLTWPTAINMFRRSG